MSPAAKLNSLIASATILLMFWLVAVVAPRLQSSGVTNPLAPSLLALITSVGLYRVLGMCFRLLIERNERARRIALGPSYMHGTWVGWFVGHGNHNRYMVEHFNQDVDTLTIAGRSFTDNGDTHGFWTSDSVSIDPRKGRLVFTYSFELLTEKHALCGIHTSLLERKTATAAPTKLSGFAHDLNDVQRIQVHSEKVSSEFLPWRDALAIAQEKFSFPIEAPTN